MRALTLLPVLGLAGLIVLACSADVEGAGPSQTDAAAEAPSHLDQLQLRAIQLLDSATQVVAEATEHGNAETAATTLKSLGIELGEIREELIASKLTLETHPTHAEQWGEAKVRLINAISLMVADNPKVAATLTRVLESLHLPD